MLSRKIFEEGLEEIEIIFSNFEMTKKRADIWYKYSKDLTDDQWKKKIENCIRFCRKIPTLADILDLSGYYKEEKDWPEVKTFEEEKYEHKPIPAEAKKIMDKLKDKLTSGYRARKEKKDVRQTLEK